MDLLKTIRQFENEKKKLWWENYVKHETKFLGIPMADLRKTLTNWVDDNFINQPIKQQEEIIIDFFRCRYSEEKLLGILLLAEHVSWPDDNVLDLIELIMSDKLVFDWNICDWLCVKVLTPILDKSDISSRLLKWSTADYLWLRRASLVPFAQIKDHTKYKETIILIAGNLIQHEERFSKTAVGWVFREMLSLYKDDILIFMTDYYDFLTSEVINNILKHDPDKKEIKRQLKLT